MAFAEFSKSAGNPSAERATRRGVITIIRHPFLRWKDRRAEQSRIKADLHADALVIISSFYGSGPKIMDAENIFPKSK